MKKIIFIILLAVLVVPAFAQQRIFQAVGKDISTSAQPIIENNVLVGYLTFTQLEKVSKDSFSYRITVMDENLNDLGVINFHELKLKLEDVRIEDSILCLGYVKSNLLGYTFDKKKDRQKAVQAGKVWMFTQFINLKGDIINTAQVPLDVDFSTLWTLSEIPANLLKTAISVRNIPGKGFVCFYEDAHKRNMVFYDINGKQTGTKKISEEGTIAHFSASVDHDVYLMMKKKPSRNKVEYTIYSYGADDNTTFQKYQLKDKKGNNLLPLDFENDPVTGRPEISGLILNPTFRWFRHREPGNQILKGRYGGVFHVEIKGHKKGETEEQFTYWYDDSKGNISAKGYFEDAKGYITPNTSFRDFNGNTYYTGSVIRRSIKYPKLMGALGYSGTAAVQLIAVGVNPVLGVGIGTFVLACNGYRDFPVGNALMMKMDSTGKVKYECTLPIKGSKVVGEYDVKKGAYCFTVVNPVDKHTYFVMADEKMYVIYSVEEKKVVRTIKRRQDDRQLTVLPGKEGTVLVVTYNLKVGFTVMSMEAV